MAYTIYFGYLPKSSLIVSRTTDIVKDTELANLYSNEVSQISFTKDGGCNFICEQTQRKITQLAYACYNAFFIKVPNYNSDGDLVGNTIIPYDIESVEYVGSVNVRISGTLSPYSLALYLQYNNTSTNIPLIWNDIRCFNAYVERGYKYDSILNNVGKVNFSSNADTDIYCLPPYSINKDRFSYSEKVKYNIATKTDYDNDFNDLIKDMLWEICYILPDAVSTSSDGLNSTTLFGNNISYDTTTKTVNNNSRIMLPYYVFCKPLLPPHKYFTFEGNNGASGWGYVYDEMVKAYEPYILAKQVTFLPPFLLDTTGDNVSIGTTTTNVTFAVNNPYVITPEVCYYEGNTLKQKQLPLIFNLPYVYDGTVNLNNYGVFHSGLNQTYTKSDLGDMDTNPYINMITQELRITDNQNGSYTYNLVNLGRYDELHISTYMSFDIGTMYAYSCIDTSYLQASVLKSQATQDYRGLLTNYNNSLLWNSDLLKQYMAQNKNFYQIRNTDFSKYVENWFFNTSTSLGLSMVAESVTGAVSSAKSGYLGVKNYWNDIKKEDYNLDNLQSAPDKLSGSANDTLFYSNNRQLGIYVDLYETSRLVKHALWQDFIKYGLYINRYVTDDQAYYYTHFMSYYDRKHLKYFKGTLRLKPFYRGETIGDKYVNSYLCSDSCLKTMETYLQNGCYVVKDSNNDIFNPSDSASELEIFNNYIDYDLF